MAVQHNSHWLIKFNKRYNCCILLIHLYAALYIPFKQDFSLLSASLFGLDKRAQQWLSLLQWVTWRENILYYMAVKKKKKTTLKLRLIFKPQVLLSSARLKQTYVASSHTQARASYLLKELRHLTHQTGVWLHLALVSVGEEEVSQQWCVC